MHLPEWVSPSHIWISHFLFPFWSQAMEEVVDVNYRYSFLVPNFLIQDNTWLACFLGVACLLPFKNLITLFPWSEKLKKMNGRNVGFPPELLDMATLTKFFDFDTFDVETDNYFENTVQIKRWWAKKLYGEIKRLGEKLVKNDWRHPVLGAPAQANAYYGNQENVIVLLAGLLQVTLIL